MTGPSEHTVVLQAASLLLQYPDERLHDALPTLRRSVTGLSRGRPRELLLGFLDHVEATQPRALQEHYVATLDRKRRACLYLTWWTDGETRRRGLSLARLKALYASHGMTLTSTELPDYLPVVLEFAALGDLRAGLEVLQEYRAGLELLRLGLTELGSPYSDPVRAVCALLPGPSPADEAAARALARSGPPVENVGLEPFGAIR